MSRVCPFGCVGCSGARRLSRRWFPLVAGVVRSVLASGRVVVVGDCSGLDSFVREVAGPWCAVARVSAASRRRLGRGAFVARSVRLVRAVARRRSFPGSGFAVFVSSPCPSSVVPGSSWSSGGSGSWSSAALAAGLGLPLVVFWCAPGPFPAPSWGGRWVPAASSGPWSAGWRWVPPPGLLSQESEVLP